MTNFDEMYDAAIAVQQTGDIEGAIAKLQQLVAENADYPLAHAALSVFYGKQKRYDEAIQHAEKVCQLEPEDPFSFVAMSLICQQAGRIGDAERALMQARQAQVLARQSQNPAE
jgi:Flp pilus assembly protein TadD